MTNNAKLRNNFDKRSRPKSWCVASTRIDPAYLKAINEAENSMACHNGGYASGKSTLNSANHEFVYRKFNNQINVSQLDKNNNCSTENVDLSGNCPKVIRRTNVDKAHRRAIVSLNLGSAYRVNYSPPVDRSTTLRTNKRNRPKSLYQNIFKRSCSLLKSHVFGDNSKNETNSKSGKNTRGGGFDACLEGNEQEFATILTDGETCIFSHLQFPLDNDNQHQWTLWNSQDDISQGYSLDTAEVESVGKVNPTEEYISNLMPWTKRSNTMPKQEALTIESFQYRRENRKYSSLRSPSKGKYTLETKTSPTLTKEQLNNNQIIQQFSPHKRHSHDNIRLNRSGSARYHRPNSVDSALKRKNNHSTSSTDRVLDDNIKNINSKSTLRNSKKGERGNAPNFFIRYQDVLREEKITDTPPPITYSDSTKFTQINEVFEYLLNLHCSKPVTKTCKQLFYIRSRLSKNARRNESMCDGCFGCDKENMLLKQEP